jgi:hypothetical protein
MSPRYVAVAPIVAQMSRLVRVTAAGLIAVGLATGCARTTTGTVAQTTEPGPPLTTSRTPPTSLPGLPIPSIPNFPLPNTDLPEVPAPPNALTMTCSEFNDLDDATKLAVIRAILAEKNNPLTDEDVMVALLLADTMCQFLPDAQVNAVLLTGGPR